MTAVKEQVITLNNLKFTEREDGIVLISLQADKYLEDLDLIDIAATLEVVCKKTKMPVLFDLRGHANGINSLLKCIMNTERSMKFMAGMAFLLESSTQRLVGNLVINVRKPFNDFKAFNDHYKAIEWLNGLAREHVGIDNLNLN